MTILILFLLFFLISRKKKFGFCKLSFWFFYFDYIPRIPTPIPRIPIAIPRIPTPIPRITVLISHIPAQIPRIPLILFLNSPFPLLQIAYL